MILESWRRDPTGRNMQRLTWWMGYVAVVGAGLFIALVFRGRVLLQPFLVLTLGVLALLLVAWLMRPRAALYVTLFLTMVGDISTAPWYPFNKNLSSRESITFVADALTTSPLEMSLLLGFVTSILRQYASTGRPFVRSPLIRPVLVFTGFVVFGFINGLGSGGDLRISLFEGRSLFYILFVYVIVTNECRTLRHLRIAMWWVFGGIALHSLIALDFLLAMSPEARNDLESLADHGASIAMNMLVMALLYCVLFRRVPLVHTLLLLAAAIPITWVYLVSQRRSAVAALAIGTIVALMVLFWRQPRTFWKVGPVLAIITVGYLGAFWTSESAAGFPAQAIKAAIAPEQAAEEDRNSDLYRDIENFNVSYTIRAAPVAGLGFGHPFLRPVTLPGITPFALGNYVPHNSFLWFWIKTGFGGFAALMYMIGKSIVTGVDRVRRLDDGFDVVVALSGVTFVVMYTVFTYVDIAWDARNMVLLGLSIAICASRAPTSKRAEPNVSATSRRPAIEVPASR